MKATVAYAASVPWTLTITTLALAAAFVPGLAEAWQFDRTLIQSGEFVRLATCHLTHWNFDHLKWDLLMFAVLGAICEIRNPRQMRVCVVMAGAAVSSLVLGAFPILATYRGLSGIDTALFILLACSLMIEAYEAKNERLMFTTGALILGFCLKTAYELLANQTFFVDQSVAGFELLVWDHIVAGVIGGLIACARRFAWPISADVDLTKTATEATGGSRP